MEIKYLSQVQTADFRSILERRILKTVDKWQPYWYPLCSVKEDIEIIAFDSDFISNIEIMEKIRTIFLKHKVNNVIRLPEFGDGESIEGFYTKEYFLQKDDDTFDIPFVSECFWFDKDFEWIMYTSHEATITFYGQWLVNAIKKELNDYTDYMMESFISVHQRK